MSVYPDLQREGRELVHSMLVNAEIWLHKVVRFEAKVSTVQGFEYVTEWKRVAQAARDGLRAVERASEPPSATERPR